ncbi:probable serine/threonine-protein kinase abkC isoform X2 [Phoenix dactylifera]|uniref:Probable serine/threonine-protein kinase abkC isoform X2 n=1 Tax=Phoenix dactylifera TaxID=42345 RepID=A0A8B9A4Y6_PHODC|nr:probable serine/threonine-protein kinase abkC isoform X2 [Phoenix dactylifera]
MPMLRLLAIHGRLRAFGKNRRAGFFFQSNKKFGHSVVRGYGSLAENGIPSSLCRMFLHDKVTSRGHRMFGGHKFIRENVYQSNCAKSFYSLSARNSSMTHHAQLVWKRLSLICSYSGPTFPPLSRIACAVSLSFTRFQVVPGILALTFGELAWAQRTFADGGYFPTRDGLHMRAEDGRVYFSLVVYSILEGIILICRAVYLVILFSPAIILAPFADSFGIQFRKAWLQLVHRTLEKAGPAFIKWGQWAATRPDLFPNDLCMELTKLHTKAPAHSFAYSKVTIEKAFGRKLSEIFENFEETPVASGSIAQVHRASLRFRYPRQRLRKPVEVAVKVRHPGVGESIKRDFVIINLVAKISNFIPGLSWLRLDESARQFAVFMMSQVDLSREAAHLGRFIYNFRNWKDVSFPRPLYPLVHPSVLVETFEQGESVSHYVDEFEGNTQIKRDLAHIGTHALLKMLVVDNFIHADMHPGNILVRVPQSKRSRKKLFRARPHIIFLDVGMTAELSKTDRANLLEFFKAVALRDGHTAAECTLRLSKRQSCPNPEVFIEHLLEQVRRHKVNIDGNVCTVLVTILVLQGWQRKLDPDFDIMQTLKTLLLKEDWAQPIDYFFS